MIIGVPAEAASGENRVAIVPDVAAKLVRAGHEVHVQSGAGVRAGFTDDSYESAGARVVPDVWATSDIVLKVQRPTTREADALKEGAAVVCFLQAAAAPEVVQHLVARRATLFAMELVPRITRAQSMDALSSQSTVAGYKAALLAANGLGRFFPMLMTAAGTVPPARVLVIGAGVAGLQAIATARRLGAVVEAFDTRPAVKEQVQSLGATFVELDLGHADAEDAGGYAKELAEDHVRRERDLIGERARQADAVITTALIPGKRAPLLITADAVQQMKAGSVIVDLAGEFGGNCELTVPGETVIRHNVHILGPLNLPSGMPYHASQLYARNLQALFEHLARTGSLEVDLDDEITRGVCVIRDGEVLHAPTRALIGAAA